MALELVDMWSTDFAVLALFSDPEGVVTGSVDRPYYATLETKRTLESEVGVIVEATFTEFGHAWWPVGDLDNAKGWCREIASAIQRSEWQHDDMKAA